MTDDSFTIKINRRDGAVEITGSDKAWIAEQLDKLAVVYSAEPPGEVDSGTDDGEGREGAGRPPRSRRRRPRRSGGRSPSTTTNGNGASSVTEKLTPEAHKKLEKFVNERNFSDRGTQKQAAIIATFLEDEFKLDGIASADLAAVYEIMGWRAPVNPRAVINNARNRDNYFRGWVNGRAKLTVSGQNFGRIDSKKGPEKDAIDSA